MVILLVKDQRHNKEFYFNRLLKFAEKDTIIVVESVEKAKEFIISQLIKNGLHIDFVLTNHKFGFHNDTSHELIKWLRSSEENYFKKGLQLMSLPVVLVHTDRDDTQTDYLMGFDGIILSKEIYNANQIGYGIKGAVTSWIDSLLNDYSILGVDARKPPTIPIIGAWRSRCKVLSKDYAARPFKLPFLIFQEDIDELTKAIDDFEKTVERISKSRKPKQEKQYHELLKRHESFILGEAFDTYFYEHNFLLHQHKKKNYEPDFILRHKFYNFNNEANLLEIKLPKEKFIVREGFHSYPSTTLMGHLAQVKDYKRYFLDKKNKNTIVSELNFLPKMSHSILLGRSKERDYHREDLAKRMKDFHFSDILLITYDDLIQKRIKLLERREMFRIQSL